MCGMRIDACEIQGPFIGPQVTLQNVQRASKLHPMLQRKLRTAKQKVYQRFLTLPVHSGFPVTAHWEQWRVLTMESLNHCG